MKNGLFWLIVLAFVLTPKIAFSQVVGAKVVPTCTITDVISEQCLKEFKAWVRAEVSWRKYRDLNQNRIAYTGFGNPAGERESRPAVPTWLPEYCEGTFQADVASDQICPKYNALKDYDWVSAMNHALLAQALKQKETPTNSSIKRRVHLDVGYTAAQFPSPHVYGLVGMHVGLIPIHSCEVNILPGTMLLRVPDGNGSKLQPSVTFGGGGCRFAKVRLPGTKNYAVFHFNLTGVHILSQSSGQNILGSGSRSNLTLMGLSITMK